MKFIRDYAFDIFIACLISIGPITMYMAYGAMHIKRKELIAEGFVCQAGREAYGPSHTRDVMYLCSRDREAITVGIWGGPVNGKYILYKQEAMVIIKLLEED